MSAANLNRDDVVFRCD